MEGARGNVEPEFAQGFGEGVAPPTLSRILNGRGGVSPEMAVRLEKALGSSAGFWLRLQLNYDLAQIQARSGKIQVRRLATPAHLAV